MERVIKRREYLLVTFLIAICVLILVKNLLIVEYWVNTISPFKARYTRDIMLYFFILVLYGLTALKFILIKMREDTSKLEMLKPYGTPGMIGILFFSLLIHFMFWGFIVFDMDSSIVVLVGGSFGFYTLLFKRLYIGDEYFILFDKKYCYENISTIIDEGGTFLRIRMKEKEYPINCSAKQIRDKIIHAVKERSIEVIEK